MTNQNSKANNKNSKSTESENLGFSKLPLSAEFLRNLEELGYTAMTPIQAACLPLVLEGKDVRAQAKTGSGKTAAFGIGLLHKNDSALFKTQALILCPTRELADQVSKELRRLARPIANTKILTLSGGKPFGPQLSSLEHAPHIVVGTPGRLLKHLEKGSLVLDHLTTLVLDEADRMLDMGFHDDIMSIIERLPSERQTLLLSATYPDSIQSISRKIQKSPQEIKVQSLVEGDKIRQIFYEIERSSFSARIKALTKLLKHHQPESCLIFCARKQQTQEVASALYEQGFHALALHGDLEQNDRDKVLVCFANGSTPILVATDVAARGLDIKSLDAVVNIELSPDPEVHIHRIGRTGRADKEGLALSLFSPEDASRLNAIEDYQNRKAKIESLAKIRTQEFVALHPAMQTLCILGGRKAKLRAGDILGALTAEKKLQGKQIGKIDIFDNVCYVAIETELAKTALNILAEGKIKGRNFRVRLVRH